MYTLSPLYKDYLLRHDREFLVRADINGVEYTNATIVDFSIENSLSMSEGFEIGTAIPSKLVLSMRLKETIPANARIRLYLALSLEEMSWNDATYSWTSMNISWESGSTEWLPLGEFFVDSREKVNDIWRFTCYDKLVWGDVPYISSLNYPASQRAVFNEICSRLGYVYDNSVVINPTYRVQIAPTGFTMRQVLGYIAGLNSSSIFIDKAGALKFKRFTASSPPVFEMRVSDYVRVKQTNPVKIYTRVVVTSDVEDGLSYSAGSGDENQTLHLINPFATQGMVNELLAKLDGFSYLPLTMDSRGFPQLEQGDILGFPQMEGASWLETITSWQNTNIPWDGIVNYRSVILRQTLSFKGGLTLRIDAPSVSEQQSEFKLEGSLSQQVNRLNQSAIKEGKPYYGVTITRQDGLIIEREDHRSKAVFNSDKLSFQADGEDKIYFDPRSGRYRFNGTLEAASGIFSGDLQAAGGTFTGTLRGVDGEFSGELRAASGTFTGTLVGVDGTFSGTITAATMRGGTIEGGTITGSTIIGATIKTAEERERIELSPSGFTFYDRNDNLRVSLGTYREDNISGHTYYNASGSTMGQVYAITEELHVIGIENLRLGANRGTIYLQGPVEFTSSVSGLKLSVEDIDGLRSWLRSLQSEIESLRYAYNSHRHDIYLPSHNHGNRQNQNWGGESFTTSTP